MMGELEPSHPLKANAITPAADRVPGTGFTIGQIGQIGQIGLKKFLLCWHRRF